MPDLLLQLIVHDRRYDARAERLCHRDNDAGKSARACLHEKRVARLDISLHAQKQICRAVDLGKRRRLRKAKTLRNGHQKPFRNCRVLGVAAASEKRADLIPHMPLSLLPDGVSDRLNHARSLQTEPVRPAGRRRILPRAL